ncbi:MAG: hypothetical protein Fur0022_09440 [Anaerolineales bacterium]
MFRSYFLVRSIRLSFPILFFLLLISLLFGVLKHAGLASPAGYSGTYQDFDQPGTGTAYITATYVLTPTSNPVRLAGGPTGAGSYMQLVPLNPFPSQNGLTFDRSDEGVADMIVADFDFRIKLGGNGRADGFGFALLDTSTYSITGAVPPQPPYYAAEEPNYTGSVGIGFDIYNNGPPLDSGANKITVHFDGNLITKTEATHAMNLAEGVWTHARVIIRPGGGYSDVSVILTPCGGTPMTVVDQLLIPGLTPYEARAHFLARSGGESADHEFDNVHVQFLDLDTSVFAFKSGCATAIETENTVELTVTRLGDVSETASVDFATTPISATANADFTPVTGTLTFAPGETVQTLTVPVLDDALEEGEEVFQLFLSNPSLGGVVAGPEIVRVLIVDDEAHAEEGYWGEIIPLPIIPIHLSMLPTGQVFFWDRGDAGFSFDSNPRLWDPATGAVTLATPVSYELFCSGHSFLADGRLLVAGGHISDGIGEEEASLYDPFTDTWEFLEDMNLGRWYPSNVTLGTGEVLVIAGTYEGGLNTVPQVWTPDINDWRYLTTAAQGGYPTYADYYPFLFQAGNGKVFYAGPQQVSRYLDTTGTGAWSGAFPSSMAYRDYGSAVMFEDGKVLMAGGSLRNPYIPVATAEVITLTDAVPTWEMTAPMNFPRRNLNLTLLPDGTVLATGGSSAPGFNNSAGAPKNAEVWNPATGTWTLLAAADRFRGYHSTAILLPDGRVLTGGGGHPDPETGPEYNFEIFYPPYLFNGPRPTIASAPEVVTYAQTFSVQSPDAADIQQVTWIRLGAVTHAFDQNQRINHLSFSLDGDVLQVTAPTNPNLAPPGHYMLFIMNGEGVPSVARIVQILPDLVVPVAQFTSSSPDMLGETTVFANTSVGTELAFGWDFGDGRTSPEENPTHVFESSGTFTVTLTITNVLGTDMVALPVEIIAPVPKSMAKIFLPVVVRP